MIDPKIIVALDFPHENSALEFASRVDPSLCRLKIGKELFTAAGPVLVEKLQKGGFEIFLDLKFHDIPNTVAAACKAAANLGVWMVNVHALGGSRMLLAAREALAGSPTKLIAVTLLTSMAKEDIAEIGLQGEPEEIVLRLARLAKNSGLDGVVCSAQEAALLKKEIGRDFLLVTPGIRPKDSAASDQRRVMTPLDAIAAGSDYLVIGRPVTQAADPLLTLRTIAKEIS